MAECILILDFGSQVTQLIARRISELGVYAEVHSFDVTDKFIKDFNPKGIILSGGPESVTQRGSPRAPECVFTLGAPVLGICYGMQTMALQLGGAVKACTVREFGHANLNYIAEAKFFANLQNNKRSKLQNQLLVWMSHGDKVIKLPPGFTTIANSNDCAIAAMQDQKRHFYGVQFHPEVTHTPSGSKILKNFVFDVCNIRATWNMPCFLKDSIQKIREQVAQDHVILGLSGGVDSSVVAALLDRAIGKQLTCIFVDHGLLRLDEAVQVIKTFKNKTQLNLLVVDAKARFFKKLNGVIDPEQKRKIIGREFIAVFEEQAKKIKQAVFLAQGTIYPDVIESANLKNKKAHNIKSHHNVGGLPQDMGLKLLEPLRDLFKDEVRKLGLELGLPAEMVYRHPFPGPGLAVRILQEVKPKYVALLQKADAIFVDELRRVKATANDYQAGLVDKRDVGKSWYELTSQAFAVFLPIKSVGVMGDGRTYDYVVALRAVVTDDFMTAHWAKLPHDFLARVSTRIINEVKGINRVVYDVSTKPPATIEWE